MHKILKICKDDLNRLNFWLELQAVLAGTNINARTSLLIGLAGS